MQTLGLQGTKSMHTSTQPSRDFSGIHENQNLKNLLKKFFYSEGGPEVCPPDYKESDDRIFWIYFALRFIGTTMLNGCVTIMDPIALVLIQEYGGEFGRERLFSSIGMAIFSPLTGILIDYYSEDLGISHA